MHLPINRRSMLAGSAALAAFGGSLPAHAQAKTKLKFSCAFTEADLRGQAYKEFAAAIKDDFDFEPYWNNTLFKQGTELVALQRDQLDLCNLAPAVRQLFEMTKLTRVFRIYSSRADAIDASKR